MRKFFAVALMTAMVVGFGYTRDAEAGITVDIIFRGTGTNTTLVSPLVPLITADVIITSTDLQGPFTGVSVEYDNSGGVSANLAAVGGGNVEWVGQALTFNMMTVPQLRYAPFVAGVVEKAGGIGSILESWDGSINPANVNPPILPAGTYNVGTVVWDTAGASVGSWNVAALIQGTDAFFAIINGNIMDVTSMVVLNGGAITIIPEPGTAALLGLGLVGLMVASRRRSA
jgi:hypothetical protein